MRPEGVPDTRPAPVRVALLMLILMTMGVAVLMVMLVAVLMAMLMAMLMAVLIVMLMAVPVIMPVAASAQVVPHFLRMAGKTGCSTSTPATFARLQTPRTSYDSARL
jgi:hypothetical protein